MPIYVYKNEETGEEREIIQTMKEDHVYFGEKGEGDLEWKRVYSTFNMSIASSATIADPFKKDSFIKATDNKKMTLGDMWDLSGELSEKRAEKAGGEDPVQREHFDNYEKKTGVKHNDDKPKSVESDGVKITFDK